MTNPNGAAFSMSLSISLHGAPRATRASTCSRGPNGTACSYCCRNSSTEAGTSTVRRITEYDVAAGAAVLMMVTPSFFLLCQPGGAGATVVAAGDDL